MGTRRASPLVGEKIHQMAGFDCMSTDSNSAQSVMRDLELPGTSPSHACSVISRGTVKLWGLGSRSLTSTSWARSLSQKPSIQRQVLQTCVSSPKPL